MPTDLRPAQPEDHGLIVGWLPDAAATLRWAGAGVRHPLRAYEWDKLLDGADGGSVLLLQCGEAVAFGQSLPDGPDSRRLSHLLVRPDRRRQGMARALCTKLIDMALAEPGVRTLTLQVAPNDIAARNLFSQFGFQGLPAAPGGTGEALLSLRRMLRRPPA